MKIIEFLNEGVLNPRLDSHVHTKFIKMSKESEPCMRRHKLVREYLANAVHNYPEPPVPVDDIEGEKWKEISGTNGLYFISDIGRFKTKVLGFEYHFCLLEPLPNANGRLTIKIK